MWSANKQFYLLFFNLENPFCCLIARAKTSSTMLISVVKILTFYGVLS